MKIDGVELKSGDKVLITSKKPRWWQFRKMKNWRRSGRGKQNGIYTVSTGEWKKDSNASK